MTNEYFDHGTAAPYSGRLAICPECGSAVAVSRRQQHLDVLHPEPVDLEAVYGAPMAEIVEWDAQDPTA